MNAKKIMGAVLVALLAAALFVGAGAAAGVADYNGKTVFTYQVCDGLAGTTWTNGANTVTFNEGNYTAGPIVEGKYVYNDTISMTIMNPTVLISAIAEQNGKEYNIAGATYYTDANLTISILSPAGGNVSDLLITNPDGSKVKFSEVYKQVYPATPDGAYLGMIIPGANVSGKGTANPITPEVGNTDPALIGKLFPVNGEYKIQGIFSTVTDDCTGDFAFAPGTPETALVGKDALTFTVATKKGVTITAGTDSILEGKRFAVTVTGKPGAVYTLKFEPTEVTIYSAGDAVIDKTTGVFTMPNGGSITVYLTAGADGETTIGVDSDDADSAADVDVTVTIVAGEITAAAEKDSYYIGNDVKLAGTNTVGDDELKFYIKGTNFKFRLLDENKVDYEAENGEWTATIDGAYLSDLNPDAGTYTIFVSTFETNEIGEAGQAAVEEKTYTTVAVALKQPFISVTEAPSVVVKGSEAVIKGTAEAADDIAVYIFGTNVYYYNVTSDDLAKIEVKDSQFTITIKKNFTNRVDAGQYFAVIQHPMYDKKFNVNMTTDGGVWLYATNENGQLVNGKELFNVEERQTANAAQALCDALDSENIDDMYVKLSFVVAGPQSIINPIPETIAQGEKLTISGTTNLGKGEVVTVEMLSTAFAAVPKATVGSASFISLVTKTDENGEWEVTFDTSGLNIDEYTVTAAVGSLDSTTTKINVVEAAPVNPDTPDTPDVPDTPDTPDTPDAPKTPGFGALAALAGLGAVAVLLLRRE